MKDLQTAPHQNNEAAHDIWHACIHTTRFTSHGVKNAETDFFLYHSTRNKLLSQRFFHISLHPTLPSLSHRTDTKPYVKKYYKTETARGHKNTTIPSYLFVYPEMPWRGHFHPPLLVPQLSCHRFTAGAGCTSSFVRCSRSVGRGEGVAHGTHEMR